MTLLPFADVPLITGISLARISGDTGRGLLLALSQSTNLRIKRDYQIINGRDDSRTHGLQGMIQIHHQRISLATVRH